MKLLASIAIAAISTAAAVGTVSLYESYQKQWGNHVQCDKPSCRKLEADYCTLRAYLVLIESHKEFTAEQCRQAALHCLTNVAFKGYYVQ